MLNVWCEFVPQMIFMMSLFGYLVIMIFNKWAVYYVGGPDYLDSFCAPSLLIMLISMILFKPTASEGGNCHADIYPGQVNNNDI